MGYNSDFATGMTPLDPPVFIGAEPLFLGALLLGLIVAGLVGWLIRDQMSKSGGKATNAIWTAVDVAARTAMQANTEALPAEAANLRRVIQDRLGKTLSFAGPLGGCVKALDTALKGEAGDSTPSSIPLGTKAEPEVAKAAQRDGAAAAAASVTIVSVHPQSGHLVPAAPAGKPGKRPMDTDERNNALRLAVAAFNDHWRHQALREKEMEAVVKELCNPGPKLIGKPVSGGHH